MWEELGAQGHGFNLLRTVFNHFRKQLKNCIWTPLFSFHLFNSTTWSIDQSISYWISNYLSICLFVRSSTHPLSVFIYLFILSIVFIIRSFFPVSFGEVSVLKTAWNDLAFVWIRVCVCVCPFIHVNTVLSVCVCVCRKQFSFFFFFVHLIQFISLHLIVCSLVFRWIEWEQR